MGKTTIIRKPSVKYRAFNKWKKVEFNSTAAAKRYYDQMLRSFSAKDLRLDYGQIRKS